MALQGRADAQHVGERRRVPCRAQRNLTGADVATRGAYAGHPVAVGGETGDLAVLDDVDSGLIGATGEPPSDVVVLGDTRAGLIRRTQDGIPNVAGDIDNRAQL